MKKYKLLILVCTMVVMTFGGCGKVEGNQINNSTEYVEHDTETETSVTEQDTTKADITEVSQDGSAGKITVSIPSEWKYELYTEGSKELQNGLYGICIYPENKADGYIDIVYNECFGVCGTGLSQEKVMLAGDWAFVSTYDNHKCWDFVSFDGKNAGIIALSSFPDDSWDDGGDQLLEILDTICYEPVVQYEFDDIMAKKPVIYLYPEEETYVTVKLDFNGRLTSTYPAYEDGWSVIAEPDGTLHSLNKDREYYCLFWEGISDIEYDLSSGFVIPGNETEVFLEETLATLGLTEREANEFIIYWLPQMEGNAYNLISFQSDVYEDNAKLDIIPEPDSILRVFMVWKGLDAPVEIKPQTLTVFERNGFTVVEWGGAEYGN